MLALNYVDKKGESLYIINDIGGLMTKKDELEEQIRNLPNIATRRVYLSGGSLIIAIPKIEFATPVGIKGKDIVDIKRLGDLLIIVPQKKKEDANGKK